jgi:pyridoxamine 5'-phosphate oxidase
MLATVAADGWPSLRAVLLKGFDDLGFRFFTNYQSRKGAELSSHPQVALLFYWPELERQVRIEGIAETLSTAESDDYFASRPRAAQIGAHASPQSQKITDRKILEEGVRALENKFAGIPVPRPANWGGYIVKPRRFEFWQGRESRLHDRIEYTLIELQRWQIARLAP